MNLLIRLLILFVTFLWKKPLKLCSPSVLKFCVLPNDLDIYRHMNNSRYMAIMDLGRLDIIMRTGLHQANKQHRWKPLVGSSIIRYKKSLLSFQQYELDTKVVGWDEKWFFIEQRFRRQGRDVAVGLVKLLFFGPNGKVTVRQVLKALGRKNDPLVFLEHVTRWKELEKKAFT